MPCGAATWGSDTVGVRCYNPCGFGCADPVVAGAAEFYQLQAPDTLYARDKWEYPRTLRQLAALVSPAASLLAIGPGNRMATEFSVAGAEAIARLWVECRPADVRSLDGEGRRFDAITMFQVRAHLDGVEGVMESGTRLAKPEAHLFVAVPNGARIAFNERNGLLPDGPPHHVSRWAHLRRAG